MHCIRLTMAVTLYIAYRMPHHKLHVMHTHKLLLRAVGEPLWVWKKLSTAFIYHLLCTIQFKTLKLNTKYSGEHDWAPTTWEQYHSVLDKRHGCLNITRDFGQYVHLSGISNSIYLYRSCYIDPLNGVPESGLAWDTMVYMYSVDERQEVTYLYCPR